MADAVMPADRVLDVKPRVPRVSALAYSLVLCMVCSIVLLTRVHVGFERVRFRVVGAPRTADRADMSVSLPDLAALTSQPAAIVLRLRGTTEPIGVTVLFDESAQRRLTVPAGHEVRADMAAYVAGGRDHRLTIIGDRAGWQLTYLEIANVHGFSSQVVKFVIVPRERPRDRSIPAWIVLPFAAALFLFRPRPEWPRRRIARVVHRAAAGFVLVLFATALLADTFTPYKILLSLDTFLFCTAVLYADRLVRALRWAEPRVVPVVMAAVRRWSPFLPHAATVGLVLWSVGQFYRPGTGFTTLILFGSEFESRALPVLREVPHAVEKGSGYDGQFYAQLALDPLLRSPSIVTALDITGYRARRILFPWVAYLIGFGQPWFVLQAYALMNVASWLMLAWLLLRWLPPRSIRPTAAWAACLLNEGLLTSVRQSLPDGPSALLVALGVVAFEKNRRWLAAIVVGLAGLGRDTNILGGAVLVVENDENVENDEKSSGRRVWRLALQAAVVIAPLMMWMAYLSYRDLAPGDIGVSNFALPLTAYVAKWAETIGELRARGWESFARFSLLSLIALTTQAAVLMWRRQWRSPWWRVALAYVGLLLVLGPSVWEGHPGAVTRVVFPMTIAFNVLLPRERWFWPLWMLGNANVAHGLEVIRAPWIT